MEKSFFIREINIHHKNVKEGIKTWGSTLKNIKTIHLIAAARPNFMKIAPLYHALKKESWATPKIIHTGQHYDPNMSDAFFQDLDLPLPDEHLEVGSGSHAEQTGRVMISYEKLIMNQKPDLIVVVGDVNSTMAASIAAVKQGFSVAHLESGLRSFDDSMPEEINRIVTDRICHYLWTPSVDADKNLLDEGIPHSRIQCVGNIMIDAFEMTRSKIKKANTVEKLNFSGKSFGLVTLHRPSNVDEFFKLQRIVKVLVNISTKLPLIFPVHPRTKKQLKKFKLYDILYNEANIFLHEPMAYIPFMNLVSNAQFVITDSGGIQEETTYMGIPCLTLRNNTERPITITQGTNRLCNIENLESFVHESLNKKGHQSKIPDLWDGKTAYRLVKLIHSILF
jgi:UDP-N-acetylglucosamine 2-epimerase (non-hydrolysing)